LYSYKKVDQDVKENGSAYPADQKPPISFLHDLLLGQWEDRVRRGLFRYDVTLCETKVITGRYGFISQLNEGRHLKKRPTEFRVDQVLQPFDDNKFNFTKVGQEEALFRFEPSNDYMAHYFPSAPVSPESNSPNIIAINVGLSSLTFPDVNYSIVLNASLVYVDINVRRISCSLLTVDLL